MYSVKDIALRLEVTPVTIYNHINKLGQDIEPNKSKIKGVTYLNEQGLNQIKISMGLLNPPEVQEIVTLEDTVKSISTLVSDEVLYQIKEALDNKFNSLELELREIKEQNKMLLDLLEEKEKEQEQVKEPLFKRIRDLFNK